jgi:hypothetical protein
MGWRSLPIVDFVPFLGGFRLMLLSLLTAPYRLRLHRTSSRMFRLATVLLWTGSHFKMVMQNGRATCLAQRMGRDGAGSRHFPRMVRFEGLSDSVVQGMGRR